MSLFYQNIIFFFVFLGSAWEWRFSTAWQCSPDLNSVGELNFFLFNTKFSTSYQFVYQVWNPIHASKLIARGLITRCQRLNLFSPKRRKHNRYLILIFICICPCFLFLSAIFNSNSLSHAILHPTKVSHHFCFP